METAPQVPEGPLPALLEVLRNVVLLAVGAAACAVAVNGILVHQQFLSSGFTGVALLVHYAVPGVAVEAAYALANIPVFALAWLGVGRRFFLYSLLGMALYTAAIGVLRVHIPIQDPILAALAAGLVMGAGAGLVLRSYGSAGGTDIVSVILFERFSIRPGTTVLAFNGLVLLGGAILFGLELALYTLVYMYVSARVLDVMVVGLSQRKAVMVVSSRWQEVSRLILDQIRRGVTVFDARGGYTNREEKVLYTVVTFRELARLKHGIRSLDPGAFVVVSETLEVVGARIGNQPHWGQRRRHDRAAGNAGPALSGTVEETS